MLISKYHKVHLVGATTSVIDGIVTAEDIVGYCARVSAPNNQLKTETAPRLLAYCINHKHFSPFEMANLVIGIETTRDISRQILRHRSFSFQEFSQRYATPQEHPIFREARLSDPKNRQSSLDCHDDIINEGFDGEQRHVFNVAMDAYKLAIENGIAKEQARAFLPEGLIRTSLYMNGTVRSWVHYCVVRCGVETQKEHRHIAKEICKLLIEQVPSLKTYLEPCLEDDYSAEE